MKRKHGFGLLLLAVAASLYANTSYSSGFRESQQVAAQPNPETALWESVKDSKDPDDYKAYLDKYPNGIYATLAKRRLAKLEAAPTAQPPEAKIAPAVGPKGQAAVPVNMTECEGTNNCATWTFLGSQGNGQWPTGEIASLTVEHFDTGNVVIHRADSTGSSAGLTATYKGTRANDRVGGEFTSSWTGHWNNKTGNWYATIGTAAQAPPAVMHLCGSDLKYCMTLTWNNGHYNYIGSNGNTGTFTLESFMPESVVMRGTVDGESGFYSVTTGKISAGGNRIFDAASWRSDGKSFGTATASWGTALNDLPGGALSPRSQPPPQVRVVCYPWFFTIVCQ